MIALIKRIVRWYRLWRMRTKGVVVGKHTEIFGSVLDQRCPHLIEIGDYCVIPNTVMILAHDASTRLFDPERRIRVGKTRILDRCFLGVGSVILPGVTVGPNAVVGANSVVSTDVPEGMVVAGVPARPICTVEEYMRRQTDGHHRTKMIPVTTPRGTESVD